MSFSIKDMESGVNWIKHCLERTKGRTWYKAKYTLQHVRDGEAVDKGRTPAQVQEIAEYYRVNKLVGNIMLSPEELLLLATTIGDITYFQDANNHLIKNLAEWLLDKKNVKHLPEGSCRSKTYPTEQQITGTLRLQGTVVSVAKLEYCKRIPIIPGSPLTPPGSASMGKSHEGSPRKLYRDDEIIDLGDPSLHLSKATKAVGLVGLTGSRAPRKIVVELIEQKISDLREERARLRKRYRDGLRDLGLTPEGDDD